MKSLGTVKKEKEKWKKVKEEEKRELWDREREKRRGEERTVKLPSTLRRDISVDRKIAKIRIIKKKEKWNN